MKPTKLTPITILTGFLGSGKTTLLNHLLSNAGGRRFAIIENEFAELGVDQALIKARTEDMIEVQNGCICCQAKDNFLRVLLRLAQRPGQFDHVLIETTGMADPSSIYEMFYSNLKLKTTFFLDSTIVLVDAVHYAEQLDADPVCAAQLAHADLVIVNKMDRATPDRLLEVEARVRTVNDHAEVISAVHGNVSVEVIFDQASRRTLGSFKRVEKPSTDTTTPLRHQDVRSVSIEFDGACLRSKLLAAMTELMNEYGKRLFRFKGLVLTTSSDEFLVLQGVMGQLEPIEQTPRLNQATSRLVFIGQGLDTEAIRAKILGLVKSR